jgi:ribulose-phosphate 3-epimerase
MGPIVLQSISRRIHAAGAHVDCHLMTEQPGKHFSAVRKAGGDSVTVHYEACDDLAAVARSAREHELQLGVAFKPETDPADAAEAARACGADIALCMSIEPGYSGQEFMPEALDRLRVTRSILPPEMLVQVDGGIQPDNVRAAHDAGASLLVAGTSIFGHEDIAAAYGGLLEELA